MIEVIFLVLFGVFSVVLAASLVWLAVARRRDMVLARSAATMLVQMLSSEMLVAMICFREFNRESFPCVLYIVAMTLFVPMQFLPIFWRAARLHFRHSHVMATAAQVQSTTSYHNNLLRRRGIMFVITAVVLSVSVAIMGAQVYVASLSAPVYEACQWNSMYEFIVLAVEAALYTAAFGYLLVRLQAVEDPLLLARELRITFAWTLVWTVSFLVFNLVPGLWFLDSVFPFSTFILVMVIGLHFISIVWPLYLSGKRNYQKVSRALIEKNSANYFQIRPYITNADAMERLREFCAAEQDRAARDAESSFETLPATKRPRQALDAFINAYNYMLPRTMRSAETARAVHDYVMQVLPAAYRQRISPADAISMMEGALGAAGVPTVDQMKAYYLPLAEFVEMVCVRPFTQTDAYASMLVMIRKQGRHGIYMNVEFREGEAASLLFADELASS